MKKASFFQRLVAHLIDTIVFWGLGLAFHNSLLGIAWVVYETVLVSQWGGYTVGKKVMGIQVVMQSGGPVDPLKAFVRALGKILSYVVLLLGFLWMLWDEKSQTWHDKLAETDVITQ